MLKTSFKVIIVDDEPNAISIIKLLLQDIPDIEIVANCENGREAISAIQEHAPDIVFLDIQMPEIDGFDVIEGVKDLQQPYFIFTTAYNEFAVQAFEVNAIDYLLKPFSDERFFKAVEKVKKQLNTSSYGDLTQKISELIHHSNNAEQHSFIEKLSIKVDGKILLVDIHSILWIEADNQYVNVHTSERSYLLRDSLNNLEGKLPQKLLQKPQVSFD